MQFPVRLIPPLLSILLAAAFAQAAELPAVVLLGDSARPGYADAVARLLQGRARVIVPEPGDGDGWASGKPALIHFQIGPPGSIPLPEYESRLRRNLARLRGIPGAALVCATSPPVGADSEVRRYNEAAARIIVDAGVPVHDLYALAEAHGAARDEALGEAVADCVVRHLTIASYRPLPAAPSGPEAASVYRESEVGRDALVPEYYKRMEFGEFAVPQSASAWEERRPSVLKSVLESLGDLPPRPAPVRARVVSVELRRDFRLEKVRIGNGGEGEISSLLLIPNKLAGPAPAVLWLHSSTPDHTQIIIPGTNGGEESLGEAFLRAGYVVLSPDAFWHGDRVGTGPAGKSETGRDEQESLFKLHLWLGRTLWGMFVRDDQVALDYLVSRPEVDRSRIGTTGMSMGSTRAWWLAAVDDRIAAAVGVACFTRYQNLIAHGQLRQHGVYYFTDGLLRHFDTEGVLALIAPRPFLALTGDLDAGSPVDGIRVLEDRVGRTYGALGARERFRSVVYPELGHSFTPAMRAELLAWFDRWLRR